MRMGLGLGLSRGRPGFRIASLFRGGAKGVAFDLLDTSNILQTDGGSPVSDFGQKIGGAKDKSGNNIDAVQNTDQSRPIYARQPASGIRNQLVRTEEIDNSAWTKERLTVDVATVSGPNGDIVVAKLIEDTSDNTHLIDQRTGNGLGAVGTYTYQFIAKKAELSSLQVQRTSGETVSFLHIYDLESGTASGGGLIQALGDGWFLCSGQMEHQTTATGAFRIVLRKGGEAIYQGDGSSGLFIARPQLEENATPTHYQKVTNQYDVTEAGVRSINYFFNDQIDDSLPATIPDLGTDATLWYATEAGVTILTDQTIGAGSFELLRGARTYAVGAIDRALTSAETSRLTSYLNRVSGA